MIDFCPSVELADIASSTLSGYMPIPVGERSELVKLTQFSNNRPLVRQDWSTSRSFLSLLGSVVVQAVAKTLKQQC